MKFDKLIQRLEEGTSPLRRLYHYTDLSNVASIVTQNKFELTYAKGSDASMNKNFKRNFYLSCSTIVRGRYATGSSGQFYDGAFQAMIELDASRVSDNYKILPVDYWYYPGRKYDSTLNSDETEERIVSRNPTINNAKKYIIAVHVYMPPPKEKEDAWDKNRRRHSIDNINRIAESGVDYYLYDNVKYFTILRREKAHKLESNTHQYELRYDYADEWRSNYNRRNDKRMVDTINWLVDPEIEIDPENKYRLERSWNWKDTYSTVDSDVHSEKKSTRPAIRQAIHKLSEYQRKHNKSLADVVKDAYERSRNRD